MNKNSIIFCYKANTYLHFRLIKQRYLNNKFREIYSVSQKKLYYARRESTTIKFILFIRFRRENSTQKLLFWFLYPRANFPAHQLNCYLLVLFTGRKIILTVTSAKKLIVTCTKLQSTCWLWKVINISELGLTLANGSQ